ncbi:MAG: cob(I)yrinic acid a,c-diamide adenosyltransferase [Alphaproteobacteria bacterium]|nr:cob(I)yrinic acid a,c-diamide adenosyltransferase [Alphaproteobacteria bacterium]MDE2012710.1 cob(I)yrinic acid a,c-diamide adenosyltransferase [Alphaproteobacteria bacterium]MDE2072034.1 cob(I)yrinic acid a,c-diamide adenosyltransferase [Alphaproteobacteria bacterium]MDE2352192.1 cob(I)yrinic acid a,c-diamide adenosyltransferase [Alphaproteobacteria bacterium]
MGDLPTDDHHRQRMERKKAVVDAAIARATDERGLLLVLTGNGKGKSSSAFGMAARALGYGMPIAVAQFIKSRRDTGEEAFFRDLPGVAWHVLGEGFTWETQNRARDIETAQKGWSVARALLADANNRLVILDELTYLLRYGYLDADDVLADIAARPPSQHVVVTGRSAPSSLIALADTVTEMRDVKHAFRAGIKAQEGIDL